jgi:NAD(P)-dependent dehydrogenase (short-subunit alcohol dehydrogenase family)
MGAGAAALAMSSASAAAQSAGSGRSAGAGLTGKSVLITGTSSGFGRLGAEHYARLGAKVFATMRNLPRPEADELRALAEDEGLDITVIEIDVTSDEQVEAGVAEAEAAAGGTLDVLINNAGIAMSGPIEVQDLEATKLMFDTNVFGAQRMIRAALPAMREAGRGQIFNVTSQLGRLIIPGLGQYSPTKFALEALSEQLAYETVEKGIDVTIIQPGGYPTEIWQNAADRSAALKTRSRDSLIEAYPQLTAGMGEASNGGGNTDPMDVPRAIAEIIAMPAGQRPLRKPVHPAAKPQIPINKVSAEQQLAMLGGSGYGPWLRAVLKNG